MNRYDEEMFIRIVLQELIMSEKSYTYNKKISIENYYKKLSADKKSGKKYYEDLTNDLKLIIDERKKAHLLTSLRDDLESVKEDKIQKEKELKAKEKYLEELRKKDLHNITYNEACKIEVIYEWLKIYRKSLAYLYRLFDNDNPIYPELINDIFYDLTPLELYHFCLLCEQEQTNNKKNNKKR